MAKKKSPEITRATIREELVKQITLKRANVDVYLSVIDDYMSMWDVKNELVSDIQVNGIVLIGVDAKTLLPTRKNNPSTKELVAINKQMLSLLKELGLSTANVGGDEDDPL